MQMSAQFAREAILNRNGLNHIQVELVPPTMEPTPTSQRKPVLMVFVIDRSGSMAEPARRVESDHVHRRQPRSEYASKMSYATGATVKFLSLLRPDDLFGVVSFDDVAYVEQALTPVSAENYASVVHHVQRIYPRGTTNISDAIAAAKRMIGPDLVDKYNCKIVLLSDGQANEGISHVDGLASMALECLNSGITVSALGIGLDYDANILANMAKSGGGLFYHVENLGELETIFADELQLTQRVTAKGVKLLMEIPDLVEIGDNLNNYVQTIRGQEIEVLIGDMSNARTVVFEIRNNFVDRDIIFKLRARYDTVGGEECQTTIHKQLPVVQSAMELNRAVKHEDVITLVMSLIKDNTILRSAEAYERGDMDRVHATLAQSPAMMSEVSHSYAIADTAYQDELNVMLPTFLKRTDAARSTVKQAYAKTSRAARGQREQDRS